MKKRDLIATVAEKTGLTKKNARIVVEAMLRVILKCIRRGPVHFAGFGTFRTSHRCARKGKNPRTGEWIDIPATTFPVFIPGKQLKEGVLNGFSKR